MLSFQLALQHIEIHVKLTTNERCTRAIGSMDAFASTQTHTRCRCGPVLKTLWHSLQFCTFNVMSHQNSRRLIKSNCMCDSSFALASVFDIWRFNFCGYALLISFQTVNMLIGWHLICPQRQNLLLLSTKTLFSLSLSFLILLPYICH